MRIKPAFNELIVEIWFFAKTNPYSEPGITAFFGTAHLCILHLSFIKEWQLSLSAGRGMKSAEIVRYFEKNLGWVPDFADILSRYKPDTLESYFAMRSSVMKDTPQGGALPLKFKEILYVVLDSITNNTEGAIAHARAAIKAGAKTEELAEALIIMAMLTGMPRLEVVGTKAFRAAEEEEKNKKKKKK